MLFPAMHKLARRISQARRVHCFCLGAAKTGTTSLAAMFGDYYRSDHEPQAVALTEMVARVLGKESAEGGDIKERAADLDIAAWLLARDRQLNLEVEASHPLGYLAPWLPEAFPDARYLVTIREPLPWLKSRLNFHYSKSPPQWRKYRHLIWSRWHKGYHHEEKLLEEKGLYSIDAYLAQYSEQYQLIFRHLPEDKRLVVNTGDLNVSVDKMGAFLGINPTTIIPKHANALLCENSVIDELPESFVASRVEAHCQWMRDYL